jgi:uncharacterized protein YqeY
MSWILGREEDYEKPPETILDELVDKIEERIKFWEKYQPENYDDSDLQNVVLKELKSLLENER